MRHAGEDLASSDERAPTAASRERMMGTRRRYCSYRSRNFPILSRSFRYANKTQPSTMIGKSVTENTVGQCPTPAPKSPAKCPVYCRCPTRPQSLSDASLPAWSARQSSRHPSMNSPVPEKGQRILPQPIRQRGEPQIMPLAEPLRAQTTEAVRVPAVGGDAKPRVWGARGGFGIGDPAAGSDRWVSGCGLPKVRERWWCSVRRFPWRVVGKQHP